MPRTRAQTSAASDLAGVKSESARAPETPEKRARKTADAPATPRSTPRKRSRVVETESGSSLSPYFEPLGPPDTPTPAKRERRVKVADGTPKLPTREILPHGIVPDPNHFGLIQEVVTEDKTPLGTWKMLIATCLLNQTSGRAARPVLWRILERWPTPTDLAAAQFEELRDVLYEIGLFNTRSKRLIAFSTQFVADPPDFDIAHRDSWRRNKADKDYEPTPISHLPGVGRYALDSWMIFVGIDADSWRTVIPLDKELRAYLIWRHAREGMLFDIHKGIVGALPPDFVLPVR